MVQRKRESLYRCFYTPVLLYEDRLLHLLHTTPVSGFGLIIIGYLLRLYMGLLNHTCQINHTCVTFSTREYFFLKVSWDCPESAYSRVPIRRSVRNIRHGSPLASCIVPNKRHGCLGLYNRCRFIHTNLYLKELQFDILILL